MILFICLFVCFVDFGLRKWVDLALVQCRVVKGLQELHVWEQCFQTQFRMDF